MSELDSLLIFLSDPRLSPHAIGDAPAWVWSPDATRVLWGNPNAAAIFDAASPTALAGRTIDPKGTAALQIARLAGTLPQGAAPRLERLRGFGGRMGGAVLCSCSRISLANRMPAILVIATETTGPRLSLADQARRLLTGIDEPVALFAANGSLLHATLAAQSQLGSGNALASFAAASLSVTALASGRAEGMGRTGRMSLHRIGSDRSVALLATFTAQAEAAAAGLSKQPVAVAPALENNASRAKPATPPTREPKPASPDIQAKADGPWPAPRRLPERRQPLRFVWQVDDAGRFTLGSDEFQALIGPKTTAALGRPWSEIAQTLSLDSEGHVARALASRETWSGISVAFPVDGSRSHLSVELSGLPVFDRDRNFIGYRGFGICRDLARMSELMQMRDSPAAPETPRTETTAPRVESAPPREEHRETPSAPAAENIVPFPSATPNDSPTLTPVERKAFSELANRLSARLRGQKDQLEQPLVPEPEILSPAPVAPLRPERLLASRERGPERAQSSDQRPILDRLPVGVLVYRLDNLIYANRAFLDWTGYGDLAALQEAGGLDALFVEPGDSETGPSNGSQSLTIATNRGDQMPVEARLFSSPWEGESALVLMLTGIGAVAEDDRQKAFEAALRQVKAEAGELRAILDNTTDGVVVLDREERVLSINRSGEVLFGYPSRDIVGHPFVTLFAQESQRAAMEALRGVPQQTALSGRDVIGRKREGGLVPLFMTISRATEGDAKLCVTFRDMTPWKKTEGELLGARRQAEMASAAKSDFLAKISHEIRTPLNAIIGFSEVMMQERFGPIGNDRYKQYLKDIHTSGGHLVALLNDLLDLSKIEAGKLELNFAKIDLNELTQETVAIMQPQANRERIIIRTSLPNDLPPVTADARSIRQIVLNLLSNSIKFTGAGGQVIISTAKSDDGDVVLRVRDTGVGMSEQDLTVALEPFRQLATSSRWGSSGTGLGLPLTKALAEANRARFRIQSTINTGTLVEVAFPGTRLAAE